MSYIVKLRPEHFDLARFRIQMPKPMQYMEISNEELFIWTAETANGDGLIGRAIATDDDRGEDNAAVGILNVMVLNAPLYTKEALKNYRDVRDGTLISFLAEKVYYHALNRIVALPDHYANELRREFLAGFRLN